MKLIGKEKLHAFIRRHTDAKDAIGRWAKAVEDAGWKHHADLKADFPSADYVGNDRYVFNIRGNRYRLVAVLVFFNGQAYVRFIGTHAEYDRTDVSTI